MTAVLPLDCTAEYSIQPGKPGMKRLTDLLCQLFQGQRASLQLLRDVQLCTEADDVAIHEGHGRLHDS